MNEMRHVLTGLRAPAKSSTLSSGIASVATATWYDVPTPIIVHCREFHEEVERDKNEEARNRENEDETGMRFVEENTTAKSLEGDMRAWSTKDLAIADVGCSEKDATSARRPGELSLQSPDSVGKTSLRSSLAETKSNRIRVSGNLQVNPAESRVNETTQEMQGKRCSTTMELNATTTVKTGADGVPTISFSFLRTDENFHESDDEIVILEVDTSDRTDLSGNQLYDLPKSASLESNRVSLERLGCDEINSGESSSPTVGQDLYDVPKPTREDVSRDESRREKTSICNLEQKHHQVANTIVSSEKKSQQRDRMKRSTRSLKSGRRSYGASQDSDGYDAGIASMSASYSDPECPNEEAALSESGGSDRSKRLRLQKRRLGKAWGRMRSWLREEKTRIGQVVNRHAKLQAVGALSLEVVPKKREKRKKKSWKRLNVNVS